MKRVLITGGAGFIGSRTAAALAKAGYVVTVLDSLSEQIHGKGAVGPAVINGRFVRGDVRQSHDWKEALARQDAVVHLAAETGTGQSMYQGEHYVATNVGGTALLTDLLIHGEHNVRKVVVASSRAVYGEGRYRCDRHGTVYPQPRRDQDLARGDFEVKCPHCGATATPEPTDESAPLRPVSVYGATKVAQEQLCLIACAAAGIPAVALRFQNVYGPGQSLGNPYTGILSIFSTRMRCNRPIIIFEDGAESRDFVYVDDAVAAILLALERKERDAAPFNIGSGQAMPVLTVAKMLRTQLASESEITVTGNYRVGDIRHNFADQTRAERDLGFTPAWNFRDGLEPFCRWAQAQDPAPDRYEASLSEMKHRGLLK